TPAWGLFTDFEDDEDVTDLPEEYPEAYHHEFHESVSVTPEEPVKTLDGVTLETPLIDLQDRLIEHLAPFGFNMELVAEDLMAGYAQLGTKSYTVLFRLLPA